MSNDRKTCENEKIFGDIKKTITVLQNKEIEIVRHENQFKIYDNFDFGEPFRLEQSMSGNTDNAALIIAFSKQDIMFVGIEFCISYQNGGESSNCHAIPTILTSI